MFKKFLVLNLYCILFFITGCQTSKLMTIKPVVWEGDENKVSVTRGAYQTTFDTSEVATEHCASFGKMAILVEEVNVWELPNTDKYDCKIPE